MSGPITHCLNSAYKACLRKCQDCLVSCSVLGFVQSVVYLFLPLCSECGQHISNRKADSTKRAPQKAPIWYVSIIWHENFS
jgi:hypothetical protein